MKERERERERERETERQKRGCDYHVYWVINIMTFKSEGEYNWVG
jgi:hypothetical protein